MFFFRFDFRESHIYLYDDNNGKNQPRLEKRGVEQGFLAVQRERGQEKQEPRLIIWS